MNNIHASRWQDWKGNDMTKTAKTHPVSAHGIHSDPEKKRTRKIITAKPSVSPTDVVIVSPSAKPVRRAGSAKGHYLLAPDFDAPLFDPEEYE